MNEVAQDLFGIVGTVQGGQFRIEKAIAEGGFSIVYRAQHESFRAPVAVKCLKVPTSLRAQERETFLHQFRAEAELLFRLSGAIDEVVRPLHAGQLSLEGGAFVPYLALEWLEGSPLSDLVERSARAGEPAKTCLEAVRLLRPIAKALALAHAFERDDETLVVVHRDLKPENIFVLDGDRGVKILDFGIAKARAAAHSRAGRATGDDTLLFTPAYAAPEQWVPKKYGQTGPWTDVWGLALTLLETMTGRAPFEGELYTMMAAACDEGHRPTPMSLGVTVARDVESAFASALAVDPAKRTPTIAAFWGELEAALGEPLTFGDADRAAAQRSLSSIPAPGLATDAAAATPLPAPAPTGGFELELDLPSSGSANATTSGSTPDGSPPAARGPTPSPATPPLTKAPLVIDTTPLELADWSPELATAPRPRTRVKPHHAAVFPDKPVGLSEIRARVATPLRWFVIAALIAAGDYVARHVFSMDLRVGPVEITWIAGGLATVAFVGILWRGLAD